MDPMPCRISGTRTGTRTTRAARTELLPAAVSLVSICLMSISCVETTTREPVRKPLLSGLQSGGGFSSLRQTDSEGNPVNPAGLGTGTDRRIIAEDGTITLKSPTISDLMRHMLETLVNDEEELFTEQLLSTVTTREFIERGYDPAEAFRELQRREKDVRALFRAIPIGEFTPGVFLRNVGPNMFRLGIKGDPDLRWSFIDVVLEKGQYKLRWLGRD